MNRYRAARALGPMEHVFRHAGGELLERPDLPRPVRGTPWKWVAVVWPDPDRPDGWGVLEWGRGVRGWQLPGVLLAGDVVEFGTIGVDQQHRPLPDTAHRWYGWLAELTEHAAIVIGPYPDAPCACDGARGHVDEIRCAQLPGPDLDPVLPPLPPKRPPG